MRGARPQDHNAKERTRGVYEEECFAFAQSYLSEVFPNPSRIDCPPDTDLQRMAEHLVPERDDETSKHLTGCSP
jgi:hypothetical protein